MHVRRRLAAAAIAAVVVIPFFSVAPAFAASPSCNQTAGVVTCTFKWTGSEQHFTVPAGVTSLDIVAVGGKGADGANVSAFTGTPGAGGFGANASGSISVTPGQVLYVEVGGNGQATAGGFNGGGDGSADYIGGASGAGGGASDVRTSSCGSPCDPIEATSLSSRLLVAGGGGGGGAAFNDNAGPGGNAGATAAAGTDGSDTAGAAGSGGGGGGGGTVSLGGSAGTAGTGGDATLPGLAGSPGQGGDGQIGGNTMEPGGGGGGGYNGGGSGGCGARYDPTGQVGGGGGGGAGFSWVDGSVTSSNITTDSTGVPMISVTYTATDQPDGRIRVGSHHFIGGNIYNSDGTGQSIGKNAVVGSRILFRIQVQNDGNGPDSFTFHATGSAAPGYMIRYYWKSTEITSSVVAGTFTTPQLPRGGHYVIEAWVKVTSTAGASASRLVTITSVGDGSTVDAVGFQVNRSN